ESPGYPSGCKNRLDLGSKYQRRARLVVKERPFSDPVPGQEKSLAGTIPDRQGKLAVHERGECDPLLEIKAQRYLGVAIAPEPMPLRLKLPAQLRVVVDLSVEHHDNAGSRVEEGLLAPLDIKNGKPGSPQPDAIVDISAVLVRSTVA